MDETMMLIVAIAAALAFPFFVLGFRDWYEKRHHRRMNRRRQDHHDLL
jgi:hypothetical protein